MAETAIQKRDIEIEGGLVKLDTYESAFKFAQSVVKSGLAPKSFSTPEAVLVAMQQGAELGLKPMQSLQHIAVINGRPSIYGKAATGIVMQSGLVELFEEWFEGDGESLTAFCKVKRKGLQSVKTAKFSMADAKKAGLVSKQVWREYTSDMLMYKARARAFTIFNDVLCGLSFAEDISEVPEARKSFTEPKVGSGRDPLLEELQIEEVEAEEVESEPITTDVPPEPPQATEQKGNVISEAQRKRLFTIANKHGVNDATVKDIIGHYGYTSTKDILKTDYEKICSEIAPTPPTLAEVAAGAEKTLHPASEKHG